MKFEFATSARILFGPGSLTEAAGQARLFGKHVLLVAGSKRAEVLSLVDDLHRHGLEITHFEVTGEPEIKTISDGAGLAREAACDLVIGIGGGSALDASKAIAALATNSGDPIKYLEVIGDAQPLTQTPLPIIAIPTTAGTGSEVTRNAVIASKEKRVKVSMRHNLMLPRVAIVDPLLTHSLPPDLSASTGMDALTQLIEPYLSVAANPLTDGFCQEGMARAAFSLKRVFEDGNDAPARENMAFASLLGGMSLANARLGAVHGMAGPLGGMFSAAHGELCACLLPLVMKANINALRERKPDPDILMRFDRIAILLTGNPEARAEDGIDWLENLTRFFEIPSLARHGVRQSDIPEIVRQSCASSSMKGNPVELTEEELSNILIGALEY